MAAIVCTKCGQPGEVTGYQARVAKRLHCRPCKAKYAKSLRERRKADGRPIPRSKDLAAEYERERTALPEVRSRRAADMRRYTADPALRERHEARWKVRRAVASGALVRQPCEKCGASPAHGHHDDYSKPLIVRWLCPTHHREHHARVGGAA